MTDDVPLHKQIEESLLISDSFFVGFVQQNIDTSTLFTP
ncbi:hypothetical protein PECL_1745 [Pediococcus claussenii ATCC BAA-344]|uniref:Uncharacterized protein n=1 Tax=Pediococcus claussenii (strain ATCC BAA-344 / DSM 14800 / JCM 18046 / KCTC 3811 / LMG 21948 / P06) TaxID=701521 RepID=G8PBH0_PEDCP|nr:hypothetical protein PECL_1745 [Pediococcus claussenii ATCC BAA-344]